MVLEQRYSHIQKQPLLLSHTIYKNEYKIDHRPNIRTKCMKCQEENIEELLSVLGLGKDLNRTPKA